jgi:hypothetical protein
MPAPGEVEHFSRTLPGSIPNLKFHDAEARISCWALHLP